MSTLQVVRVSETDGTVDLIVCDGVSHYTVKVFGELPNIEASLFDPEQDPCDGLCRQSNIKPVLNKMLEKYLVDEFYDRGVYLRNHVMISKEAQAVLASSAIDAIPVAHWYLKKNGSGETFVLADGRHLRVDVSFDCSAQRNTGYYKTIKVVIISSCDDECPHRYFEDSRLLNIVRLAIEREKTCKK